MKLSFKQWLRYKVPFLWRKTPEYKDPKQIIWGTGDITSSELKIPKIIWLYWDTLPFNSPLVEICIDEIKRLNPEYEIRIVTKNNLSEYIPDFPEKPLSTGANFGSDLIRLIILERYGGVYIDASTLLSQSVDWALKIQQENQSEAVFYYTDHNSLDPAFPMVENWFLAAVKGSKFIRDWRITYQSSLLSPDPLGYFEKNEYYPLEEYHRVFNSGEYHIAYLAGHIVIHQSQDYRLSLIRAEDDAYLYSLQPDKIWNRTFMTEVLLLNKAPMAKPRMIKLCKMDRIRLDYHINKKYYRKSSWLGELASKLTAK